MADENNEEVVDDFAAAFAEAVQGVADPDKDAAEAAAAVEMGTADAADDKATPPPAADDKGTPPPAADDKGTPPPAADDKGTPPPAADDKGTPPSAADDKGTPPPAADDKGTPPPAADDKGTPPPSAVTPPIEDQFPDPVLSEDDTKALDAFAKNWDEIAPAVDIKVKHVAAALEVKVARTLAKIVGNIYADFAPVIQSHVKAEASSFRGEVLKAHDDFDAVYPKLESWIKTHPAYLQSGLLKAYNEGTAEEVIDLVGRYKQANGVKPQASAPAVVVNDEPVKTPSATAAALAPVSTKRTTPKPSGADPEDYDSAFDEAAAGFSK